MVIRRIREHFNVPIRDFVLSVNFNELVSMTYFGEDRTILLLHLSWLFSIIGSILNNIGKSGQLVTLSFQDRPVV